MTKLPEDPDALKQMFDMSQQQSGDNANGPNFSKEEADRFRNAFDDPEFRKMFSDYVDEIQNPEHRAEQRHT